MAWGKVGSLRSCDALLKRVEDDDPRLTELVVLPMKDFGAADAERLSHAIASGSNTHLRSISASGHVLPPDSLGLLGRALSAQAEREAPRCDDDGENEKRGIESLAIGSKDMGDAGAGALCGGLRGSNGGMLRSLDLGWKNLGKEGMGAIGRAFALSKLLSHLDLSRNANAGNEGIIFFADTARESAGDNVVAFPSMETLVLSECGIGPTGMQSLAQMIVGSDDFNRIKPIELVMGANPLGSEGCDALSGLCAIPSRRSAISRLRISGCSIGDAGIRLLAAAAMSNSCAGLAVLDLSDNSISMDGAMALAESLARSWPDLVELNLAKNDLQAKGVAAAMGALVPRRDGANNGESPDERNSTLRNLDLSRTGCGAVGAKSALMCGALVTLRLFDNRLGSEGFLSISPLLRGGHPSIENLDLGGNSVDEEAVVTLLQSIADGPTALSRLSVLEIGGNTFRDKAMVALADLKRARPQLDVAHDKPVREAEE